MRPVIISLAWNALIFAAQAAAASPDTSKLHGDFTAASKSNQSVNVIIRFATAPNAKLHAMVQRSGGHLVQELALINSAAYRIPAANLAQLAGSPEVEGISLDREVKATMDVTAATV